ncbi:hypothetical protein [Bathymodiolus japonicus methanotrophic gill symbiont]|nr:hypothetical protein [Bathymodiolus japonicus methanotrophic gill symbiont]
MLSFKGAHFQKDVILLFASCADFSCTDFPKTQCSPAVSRIN